MTRTPALSSPVTRFKWLALFALLAIPVRAADAAEILSRDHTVEVRSTVPAIAGQTVKLYDRTARVEDPSLTAPEPAFNTQSRAEFLAFWDAQKAGPDHFDPRAVQSVWNEMLASDPVAATSGPGVRRAPEVTLGLGARDGEEGDDAHAAGGGRARHGDNSSTCARPARGPRQQPESPRRSRPPLAPLAVGAKLHAHLPRLARMAGPRHRQRPSERRGAVGLRGQVGRATTRPHEERPSRGTALSADRRRGTRPARRVWCHSIPRARP
jgi:hypothetical protein